MEQLFALMAIIGGFLFIGMGLSVANSIECKESKTLAEIMTVLTASGAILFLIGFLGLAILEIFF